MRLILFAIFSWWPMICRAEPSSADETIVRMHIVQSCEEYWDTKFDSLYVPLRSIEVEVGQFGALFSGDIEGWNGCNGNLFCGAAQCEFVIAYKGHLFSFRGLSLKSIPHDDRRLLVSYHHGSQCSRSSGDDWYGYMPCYGISVWDQDTFVSQHSPVMEQVDIKF